MPRIAKPPYAEMPRLRRQLREYLERTGSNPTELSKKLGMNQSTVQRFLVGRTKNVTGNVRALLNYADIKIEKCIDAGDRLPDACGHPEIRRAVEKVWDGTDYSAQMLARALEAIGSLLFDHGSPKQRGRTGEV